MKVVVMRSAVLMEDEGRDSFVAVFDSPDKALDWITKQKDEYFKPSDYYIVGGESYGQDSKT